MRSYITLFCMLLLTLFNRCSSPTDVSDGGSGVKTGNPAVVTGMVITKSGNSVEGAQVITHPKNYIHRGTPTTSSYYVKTDKNGVFRISIVDTGDFCVEISDNVALATLLHCRVNYEDSSINLGTETIQPFATIKGSFKGVEPGKSYKAHIYGLERTASIDTTGHFQFSNLPAGMFTIGITESSQLAVVNNYKNIQVTSGTTLTVPFSEWLYSSKLFFNTTTAGIELTASLYNIPVLIQLKSQNFDFSQALKSGQDLRFRKTNGIPVPYEIDHWDSLNQTASIWVLMDTLYANNDKKCIVMHWGNPAVTDSHHSSVSVFDSGNGFQGVWHLGDSVEDASPFNRSTTVHGTFPIPGVIGIAQKFSGNEYIEIEGLLGKPTNATLSAWVNLEQGGTIGSEIVSLGDALLIRMDDTLGFYGGVLGSYHYDTLHTNGTRHHQTTSNQYLQNTGWHNITYTYNGAEGKQFLYIDGKLAAATDNSKPIIYDKVGTNTFIGIHGDSATAWNFNGIIDEVQISKVCRSADWIKFSYENQNGTGEFVRFEP